MSAPGRVIRCARLCSEKSRDQLQARDVSPTLLAKMKFRGLRVCCLQNAFFLKLLPDCTLGESVSDKPCQSCLWQLHVCSEELFSMLFHCVIV